MGLLSDTQNGGLRMHQECREFFPHHRLQWKLLVSDPGMHHGTCVTHVPRCMSESQTRGGGESVPSIPSACTVRNFAYLVRALHCSTMPCLPASPDHQETWHWLNRIHRIMRELPWITIFWSRVMWFANGFHEWQSHEWKPLANYIIYFLHVI